MSLHGTIRPAEHICARWRPCTISHYGLPPSRESMR
jgi:hypothetical protein